MFGGFLLDAAATDGAGRAALRVRAAHRGGRAGPHLCVPVQRPAARERGRTAAGTAARRARAMRVSRPAHSPCQRRAAQTVPLARPQAVQAHIQVLLGVIPSDKVGPASPVPRRSGSGADGPRSIGAPCWAVFLAARCQQRPVRDGFVGQGGAQAHSQRQPRVRQRAGGHERAARLGPLTPSRQLVCAHAGWPPDPAPRRGRLPPSALLPVCSNTTKLGS